MLTQSFQIKETENSNFGYLSWASLVVRMIKYPSTMQETRLWSLGWEDPLEKGMATHSSVLAWRIPWTEELGHLQSPRLQRIRHNWVNNTFNEVIGLKKFKKQGVGNGYLRGKCIIGRSPCLKSFLPLTDNYNGSRRMTWLRKPQP